MLRSGLSVVQMPMLPVEPGMTQLMGENVAPSGQRQSLSQIDRLVVVIPNSVRIRVTTIHLSFGQLPNRNVIAEWKYDSCGNSVPHGHTLLISLPQTVLDDESPNGRNINNLRYFPLSRNRPGSRWSVGRRRACQVSSIVHANAGTKVSLSVHTYAILPK